LPLSIVPAQPLKATTHPNANIEFKRLDLICYSPLKTN
jgi:hypothetical protein